MKFEEAKQLSLLKGRKITRECWPPDFFAAAMPKEIINWLHDSLGIHLDVKEGDLALYQQDTGEFFLNEDWIQQEDRDANDWELEDSENEIECIPRLVETDVHTSHCCIFCGCKYGNVDNECSVVSGNKKQEYKCGDSYTCQ